VTKGLCDDKDYYYEREGFLDKVYFTKIDFDYFLSTERKNNYFYDMMKEIDKKFIENNYDTFGLKLKNKVKPYDFTVEELLNSYIYMRYASYNIK
jgi:AAA15 family ATPase/GTPase